jgi:hypothetical protein
LWQSTLGFAKFDPGKTVLLHNGGFCNGCITKRILLLQAFRSQENQNYAGYGKKYYIFINLIFYHREIVRLDHFMTLCLSFAAPKKQNI